MLTQPIFDKLQQLRFYGMLKALEEHRQMPDIDKFGFEDRLGLLLDREMTVREDRRLKTRLRKAKLRQNACVEDVDFRHPRKLDKTLFMGLADGSKNITTFCSSAPQASAKRILHVHWPKKPVGKATVLYTSGFQDFCTN